MSTHIENSLDALADMNHIVHSDPNAFIEVQRLAAVANTSATLALVEATNHHTQVISAFMASTMTQAQAKTLVKALAGLGASL